MSSNKAEEKHQHLCLPPIHHHGICKAFLLMLLMLRLNGFIFVRSSLLS